MDFRTHAENTTHILVPGQGPHQCRCFQSLILVGSEELYNQLRQVHMNTVHNTYCFPMTAAGVTLITPFDIEYKNIKYIGKEREQALSTA